MEEKRYLKWYNKFGYGSGDLASNLICGLVTSFAMLCLTTTLGLNAGIIGTLILAARLLDGVSDLFFGTLIDRTHSKMGKARPWMLYGFIGNAICVVCIFTIPSSWKNTVQYIYFFIYYTLLNAVFYTATNVAYSALTALITRNGTERVQIGTFRMILVQKVGSIYKINLVCIGLTIPMQGIFVIAGYMQNVPLMLISSAISSFCISPMLGTVNALIAATSDLLFKKSGKRIDGVVFSCASLGNKVGNGLGAAMTGWLLAVGGFVGTALVQSESCINMRQFMYCWFPLIVAVIEIVLATQMNVEKANREWD